MRNYDRINVLPPDGIEKKRAHIIGGGLAGLAAAAFLVDDARMPADRVTVYEAWHVLGGALHAGGDHQAGYTALGDREFDASDECLWYLFSKVPSLDSPGLTVLDETHQANVREPIHSNFRLMEHQGRRHSASWAELMDPEDGQRMLELFITPEEQLEDLTIADWFDPGFFTSVFWLSWSSLLSFWPCHSVMEARRYLLRFMDHTSGIQKLEGILHTRYNEYQSWVKPLHAWLERQGVQFRTATKVTGIEVCDQGRQTVATGLRFRDAAGQHRRELTRDDLVFFTNGSIVANATPGDNTTPARFDRSTADRGVFTVWEKLAARDPKFGNPAAFISDIDKTGWISYLVTLSDNHTFFGHMQAKTGSVPPTGGIVTAVDSSWMLSVNLHGKFFPGQPDDVDVFAGYALLANMPGDHVEKTMQECTGAEILAETLYHCGLEDKINAILPHADVHTSALPYITSQFMPRHISDRPRVIPDGCVNLAFMGQYVELPGDVVFTTEYAVRSAMMAVWGLTGLDKPMVPLPEPYYDLRVLADNATVMGSWPATPLS